MHIRQLIFILTMVTLPHSSLLAGDAVRNFWFNGAEINRYELSQSRYGEQHPGHAEFIFVTEPFLMHQQVKDERGIDPSTDVLKLNALRTFNTGIYSYRTMTSTFRPIDLLAYPHALKTTTSVQDWCGHAYQQINRTTTGWAVELRSYFETEGDQNTELNESWLEDEFWLLVRLDPMELPTGLISVVPGALTTRFAHLPIKPQQARTKLITTKAQSTYSISYPELQRALHIHFDREFPHIIRAWAETSPQGTTTAKLTHRTMNSSYWSEQQVSDRDKRKQLGLEPIAD
jgi:hypothetical protein